MGMVWSLEQNFHISELVNFNLAMAIWSPNACMPLPRTAMCSSQTVDDFACLITIVTPLLNDNVNYSVHFTTVYHGGLYLHIA